MYKVLKDFKGSPDGRFAVDYKANEVVDLSASLAETALAEGWVEAVEPIALPGDSEAASPSLLERATSAVRKFRKAK